MRSRGAGGHLAEPGERRVGGGQLQRAHRHRAQGHGRRLVDVGADPRLARGLRHLGQAHGRGQTHGRDVLGAGEGVPHRDLAVVLLVEVLRLPDAIAAQADLDGLVAEPLAEVVPVAERGRVHDGLKALPTCGGDDFTRSKRD
jgi:hypothetical protein